MGLALQNGEKYSGIYVLLLFAIIGQIPSKEESFTSLVLFSVKLIKNRTNINYFPSLLSFMACVNLFFNIYTQSFSVLSNF